MNIKSRHLNRFPVIIILLVVLALDLKQNWFGQFSHLDTFVIGLILLGTFYDKKTIKRIFQPMQESGWLVFFFFLINYIFDVLWRLFSFSLGVKQEELGHSFDQFFNSQHSLWQLIFVNGRFLFSAVNEELVMIPILLVLYQAFGRGKAAFYGASLIVAVGFALLHFSAYQMAFWIFVPLFVSRLILNQVFWLAKSIRASMYLHFVLDALQVLILLAGSN
ncbi:type II CAAX prenyl endopeptidase Rce1 family protein [Fructobacillus durionis]|uniref:CAAX prenyl protease 2/Lysostaphin resistance protein A-like domain-containing protein n=1 Tax=Fructobacillus durionis TaxID=283737 RepID=A0A1I1G796_9LACO|nr:CPBP family glutamic-type intramembrane protease [Fructobacillus durionis]SFC05738.1 hypothetical protein SAMN05660453_0950 [Fructobacillus durionis]